MAPQAFPICPGALYHRSRRRRRCTGERLAAKDNAVLGEGAMVGGHIAMGGRGRAGRVGAAIALALTLLAVGAAQPAMAAPMLAIETPATGSVTDHASVTISGTTTYVGSREAPTEVA